MLPATKSPFIADSTLRPPLNSLSVISLNPAPGLREGFLKQNWSTRKLLMHQVGLLEILVSASFPVNYCYWRWEVLSNPVWRTKQNDLRRSFLNHNWITGINGTEMSSNPLFKIRASLAPYSTDRWHQRKTLSGLFRIDSSALLWYAFAFDGSFSLVHQVSFGLIVFDALFFFLF